MKNKNQSTPKRPGFTLVELLVVIAIIGILAAITVPVVGVAMRRARTTAIRLEIDGMSQAMEAYNLEYGSYPPDFYNWNQVERHFRKAFPSIDDNELRILSQFTHYTLSGVDLVRGGKADPRDDSIGTLYDHYPHAIDRAEALVFCLGGYSADVKHPFTGPGGPLVKRVDAAFFTEPDGTGDDYLAYQYNTDRAIGQFEFEVTQLSMVLVEPTATVSAFTYSRDENPEFGGASEITVRQANNDLDLAYYSDPFPTYRVGASTQPVVYFHKSNYDMAWGAGIVTAWNPTPALPNSDHLQNIYLPNGTTVDTGVARPYASTLVDTTPPGTIRGMTVPASTQVLKFAEQSKFQLISAGLDGNFGGLINASWGAGAAGVGVYSTGGYYNPFVATASTTTKYQDDLENGSRLYSAQPQLDNITNFSTSSLESDLP